MMSDANLLQLILILGTAVALVVWTSKRSSARAERITDKFIDHLQTTQKTQEAKDERFQGAMNDLATAVKAQGQEAATAMRALTTEVGKWSCKAHTPPPQRRTTKKTS